MRDNVEVPLIVEKCCAAIEKWGLGSQGIYRISGTTSKVAKLKGMLDRGEPASIYPRPFMLGFGVCLRRSGVGEEWVGWAIVLTFFLLDGWYGTDLDAVNLDADEWSSDINNVTSVLKLWLRELPEPVMTTVLHQHFIDAASESRPLVP